MMHNPRPGRDGISIATIVVQNRRPVRDAIGAMSIKVREIPSSIVRNQWFAALTAFSGIWHP
ncbi:MAG: hypothetical protein U5R06_04105 [candidate division KSB1 bacterium]|nr:hypothetical protein [candidate division KSB1 bacterium]